ncbi:MAG: hypothetical protein M5U28_25940 [Sandaracinaceae bacterium]|nr:hypothetical protein [Sandaracinaceae bacterium]
MRTLLLLAVPLLCAALGLASAQDYEAYYERYGGYPGRTGPGAAGGAADRRPRDRARARHA